MSKLESTEQWEAQLRRGYLEIAVLGCLWDGSLYALEMLRKLEQAESGLTVTEGTIYPLLGRLRAEGIVNSTWVESQLGHPRRYYELTQEGRQRLLLLEERWTIHTRVLDTILRPLRRAKRIKSHG